MTWWRASIQHCLIEAAMLLSLWYVLGLLSESTLPCYLSVYFYLGLTFAFLPLAVDPLFFSTPGFLARNFHVHWRVFLEPAVKYLRQLLRSERLRPANVHVHLCIHLSLNFVSYIVPIFSLVPVMFSHIYKNYPVFFFDEKIIGTYANLWGRACVKLAGT